MDKVTYWFPNIAPKIYRPRNLRSALDIWGDYQSVVFDWRLRGFVWYLVAPVDASQNGNRRG